MSQEKPDYDSPWKVVLDRYFESFLEFFFPDLWEDVNYGISGRQAPGLY